MRGLDKSIMIVLMEGKSYHTYTVFFMIEEFIIMKCGYLNILKFPNINIKSPDGKHNACSSNFQAVKALSSLAFRNSLALKTLDFEDNFQILAN